MSETAEAKAANGGGDATLAVDVWRGTAEGRYQRFEVPYRPNQTVLDVVTYIQRNLDPALAYRFACR
ncbi:MAG: 2Fe-2S iron-sulfur cluster-binding protein, partial [Methyloligellaceae bacterium]